MANENRVVWNKRSWDFKALARALCSAYSYVKQHPRSFLSPISLGIGLIFGPAPLGAALLLNSYMAWSYLTKNRQTMSSRVYRKPIIELNAIFALGLGAFFLLAPNFVDQFTRHDARERAIMAGAAEIEHGATRAHKTASYRTLGYVRWFTTKHVSVDMDLFSRDEDCFRAKVDNTETMSFCPLPPGYSDKTRLIIKRSPIRPSN